MSLTSLDPRMRPYAEYLYRVAEYYGLEPRITSTRRDPKEQQRLWDRRQRTLAGRLLPGEAPQRYPVARPGTSRHEHGLAFDMVSRNEAALGGVWRYLGGFWTSNDSIHYGDVG